MWGSSGSLKLGCRKRSLRPGRKLSAAPQNPSSYAFIQIYTVKLSQKKKQFCTEQEW